MEELSSEEVQFVLNASPDHAAQGLLERFTDELLDLESQLLRQDGRFDDLHQGIADSFDTEFQRMLSRVNGDEEGGIARFFVRKVTYHSCAIVFIGSLQEFLQLAEQTDEHFGNLIELASALRASLPNWLDEVGRSYQLQQDVVDSTRSSCQTDDFVRNASELWQRYLEWTIRVYAS